jgi:hypothetical protein
MKLKRGVIVIVVVPLFATSVCVTAETINATPDNTRFICHFKSLPKGGDTVDATFYGNKPPAAIAAKLLRSCLEGAGGMGGNRQILGTAWYSPTGRPDDEKQYSEKDGVPQLVYDPKTKKIENFKW